jgi:hypothetical protein
LTAAPGHLVEGLLERVRRPGALPARQLHSWLRARPYTREGYYRSDGRLFLARKISTRDRRDYRP